MELKRIIARDSRSANEKAIQLYGPDVLVISSQRVDQQTELIVAVDVADESLERSSGWDDTVEQPQNAESRSQDSEKEFLPFSKVFQNAHIQTPSSQAEDDFDTSATDMPVPSKEASQAAPLFGTAPHPYEKQRSHEIVDMLREEMAALRKEFALSRQMQPWQQNLGLSSDIQKLCLAMQEVGIPVTLRSLLADSVQQLNTLEEAWPVVQQMLVHAINRPSLEAPVRGVHVLCGPSGAGKTSMLGRLAFAAAQTHGAEQQVMISYGNQRPGAWSQIQLLASQAGTSCFRAADLGMLQTLLDELHGKTIWIDTPGADFALHAQQLQSQLRVDIHAVLPVDATVTSVQKILQSSEIRWSSLMLTKVDEAAYPWPLIKGLCESSVGVSCMAEDSKINLSPLSFDAARLVGLAMIPLQASLPEIHHLKSDVPLVKKARKSRAKKVADPIPAAAPKSRLTRTKALTSSSVKAVHG